MRRTTPNVEGGAGARVPQQLRPLDEHNRTLLQHTHPPDWTNPEPRGRYQLLVVGGGTGGLVTAAIGAALGARVALVERNFLGGDCLHVGCVPSKALLGAAHAWHAAREAASRFGGPDAAGAGRFAAAMERMRRIRAEISPHDSAQRFADLGVDVFLGDATFVAEDAAEVEGVRLEFRRAVVAAGTRAVVPPIDGLEDAGYLTNESVFSLTSLPERLVVMGAGPIGCELAQAFARLGSRVTLLDIAPRVLPNDDPDAAALVEAALRRDGVEFLAGAHATRVERDDRGARRVRVLCDGEERSVVGDELLVAVGRAPNVDGLGLERAGVRFDARRGVEVDDRLRTSSKRIYAVGDIAATPFKFTHAADAHARLAIRNALFFGRGKASELVVPWATYTRPELAHVGLGWEQARERDDVETLTVPFAEVDRARLDGDSEGFLRIHLQRGGDRILGATLVGEHAGELVSHIATAMTQGLGLHALGETIFPYPTRAEILRRAADQHRRGRLTPRVSKALEWFFRLMR